MDVSALGIPPDLSEYLATLITPFHIDGKLLIVPGPGVIDWTPLEDDSFHAAILVGDPSSYLDDLWRVLKPGAHVCAVAPEDQPTGHSGAIALEDRGFEVRDAILWVDEPGKLHYIPKPSQRERHDGCEHLKFERQMRQALEDVEDPEDDEELLAAVAELEFVEDLDRNLHKGNAHPTVKAKAIMARLLEDVPKTGDVLDPFMGSGTTALACLETGHDFIGIEMSEDYLEIADTRVRHHDRARVGDGATIESEHLKKERETEEVDFFDFLE